MNQGLGHEVDAVLNDVLSLQKRDGRVIEGIRAHVSAKPRSILIMDVMLPLEVGDWLVRVLPNGTRDEFVIDDPRYVAAVMGLAAHFQVLYHRATEAERAKPPGMGEAQGGASSRTPDTIYWGPVHFQYRYPDDFPANEQRRIELLRREATKRFQEKPIDSFADWSEAKRVWVLEIASGAATIIGRFAAMKNWSANQVRGTLKDFTLKAAFAAGMTAPEAERFFQSDEWKRLDDELFPLPDTNESPALTPPGSAIVPEEESAENEVGMPEPGFSYERISKDREPMPDTATVAKRTRAATVAKLIKELDDLHPQMFEDEPEYQRLRTCYPEFLTFKVAEGRADLKLKVLGIRGSTRHIMLAQQLAAAYHGRKLSTIQDDWKDHKPQEFKRPR